MALNLSFHHYSLRYSVTMSNSELQTLRKTNIKLNLPIIFSERILTKPQPFSQFTLKYEQYSSRHLSTSFPITYTSQSGWFHFLFLSLADCWWNQTVIHWDFWKIPGRGDSYLHCCVSGSYLTSSCVSWIQCWVIKNPHKKQWQINQRSHDNWQTSYVRLKQVQWFHSEFERLLYVFLYEIRSKREKTFQKH